MAWKYLVEYQDYSKEWHKYFDIKTTNEETAVNIFKTAFARERRLHTQFQIIRLMARRTESSQWTEVKCDRV